MRFCSLTAALFCSAVSSPAEPAFAIPEKATWEYEVVEQNTTEAPPAILTVRTAGRERVSGKDLLKLETLSAGLVTKTEFVAADEHGFHCYRRMEQDGKTITFDPPQILLAAPLQVGTKWERRDEVAGVARRQQITIAAEEEVALPAGTYRSFRLHSEEAGAIGVVVERWFVPAIGFVKDVTTMRGPGGQLFSRVTTTLKSFSQAAPEEEQSPALPEPTIILETASEREGEMETAFRSDTPNIFVRWSGQNLPINTDARIGWIAEDVGDVAPPNFVVDVSETSISARDFSARFTLSRPKDGWAPGTYRVDLYIDGTLAKSLKVTIED